MNELNVSSFNGQENENANTKHAEFTKAAGYHIPTPTSDIDKQKIIF